MAATSTQRL